MFIQFPQFVAFALTLPLVVATAAAAEPPAPDRPNTSGSAASALLNKPPEAAASTPPVAGSSAASDPNAARLATPPQVLDMEVPRGQSPPTREQLLRHPWLTDPARTLRRPNQAARDSGVTTLIAGGINGAIGVGLLAGSLALLSQNTHCSLGSSSGSSTSGCGNALFGWSFLGFGGTHLLVGSILLIVGGTTYANAAE